MSATTRSAIPQAAATDDPVEMYEALADAGCLVISDALSIEEVASVRGEMANHMAAAQVEDDRQEDFYPGNTRRAVALMHRSPTVRELVTRPLVERLCEQHLLSNCQDYQLHVTAGLEVGPGARDQVLHREEDSFPFFPVPRPNLILATMWALSDFTADNGGTQLVPGSHHWEAERVAEPHEVVRAEMPAGSVLVWAGGTLHGAGANITEDVWRYGVILTFSLSWLRQEENQSLSMPLVDALELPDIVRDRLGFGMDANGSLGFYDPTALM